MADTTQPTAPVGRRTLLGLTATKTVVNTGVRWIAPFLSTLETAFSASTSTLTTIMGVGELSGLTTLVPRRRLDQGGERLVMIVSLLLVSASALVALTGSVIGFALSFVVLMAGVSNYTAAGHAWLSHRVPYTRRARSIGLFETGWALALLIGAPLVAVLINTWGWRAPFIAVATIAGAVGLVMAARGAGTRPHAVDTGTPEGSAAVTPRAIATITGNSCTAAAGLAVLVVSGAWLSDDFGVSTGGLGAIAMVIGGGELLASGSSAAFADRWGKSRCATASGGVLVLGAVIMALAEVTVFGALGLVICLIGFEFGYVTSFSLVSEAIPDARGATIGLAYAVATIAKAAGATVSGLLYSTWGIGASALFASVLAVVASASYASAGRRFGAAAADG